MQFDPISWEAFATLFTGLAAVTGAVVVGWRQTAIIKRQAEIERLSLNASLFDRRMKVVDSFHRLRRAINWRAGDPGEALADFALNSEPAVFLFPSEVTVVIEQIWSVATQLISARNGADRETNEANRRAILAVAFEPVSPRFEELTHLFLGLIEPHMALHAGPPNLGRSDPVRSTG